MRTTDDRTKDGESQENQDQLLSYDPETAERFRLLALESRQWMLDFLKEAETAGRTHLRWISARDKAVCPKCTDRDDKVFSIAEVREILREHYCDSHDEVGGFTGCRCVFLHV